ncbi:Protein BZZ1 [Escovopsis weberi]|uniref:Protein BZZ1 n=1 Tax=Escovopsis weberi TaxID=150374 RepID=A0A0M9VXF5_ESCWE|nr:Protein BZZ1 [Escovopsis weberi]
MAADVDAVPTFGAELKDGFKPANAWVGHGIAWLDDIQAFYRERAAIEKEYSAKLEALAKRHFEKKNKKIAQLSVGDSPAMTPGSLESASLTTWATQLTTLESRAGEHSRYADQLLSQVAEPLKFYGNRFDELRKRHAEYAEKLEATREACFADLRKTKTKYDSACHELEAKRKKTESHYDKSKAQSNYQHQLFEMNNAKNTYLIAINVTNRQTDRYYHEYVPEVMDSLQDLSEFRTLKLNFLWGVATRLEGALLQQSNAMMDHQGREIERNLPHLDSMMYMRHNMGTFHQPADRAFEPSPVWHDDDAMVVDETAKIYLRNVLTKSKAQLGDLRREVDKKRREVEGLKRVKQRVRDGAEKKDEVEVIRSLFGMQEDLIATDQRRLTAEVETSTITAAVGDVTLGAKNHNFKSQTFKIPTNCDLCGERIWGLSAKGFDCRDCGYTCHSKCEMKVPADCPGEQSKDERKKLKAERQAAANALLTPDASIPSHVSETSLARSSTRGSTTASSHSARHSNAGLALTSSAAEDPAPADPPPSAPSSPAPSTPRPAAAAAATTPVRKNRIMAPPPAAYVKDAPPERSPGAEREEKPRGKMLYPFDAGGDGELSVAEGKEVVLLEADDGSGWVKVRDGYKEGLVPASYVSFDAPPRPRTSSVLSTASSPSSPTPAAAAAAAALAAAKKKGPAVAPKRGAKKLRYAEALYDYTAQSSDEHSIVEGERFVLVRADAGDGWAEIEKAGVTASVPANYIQAV